jgi:hypothetical protein
MRHRNRYHQAKLAAYAAAPHQPRLPLYLFILFLTLILIFKYFILPILLSF